MTKKTAYLGRESGKSSMKMFGGPADHPGYGARAGDGRTANKQKIDVEFQGVVKKRD